MWSLLVYTIGGNAQPGSSARIPGIDASGVGPDALEGAGRPARGLRRGAGAVGVCGLDRCGIPTDVVSSSGMRVTRVPAANRSNPMNGGAIPGGQPGLGYAAPGKSRTKTAAAIGNTSDDDGKESVPHW